MANNKEYDIHILDLFQAWWRKKIYFIISIIMAIATGLAFYKFIPATYTTSISIAIDSNKPTISSSGALSVFGGLGMDLQKDQSPMLKHITKFARTREFTAKMKNVIYKDSTLFLRYIHGKDSSNLHETYYNGILSDYEIRKDMGLFVFEVTHWDPDFAHFLVELIYKTFETTYQSLERETMRKNFDFLNGVVMEYNADKEQAAKKLEVFLKNNHKIESPVILREKGDLELELKIQEEKYIIAYNEKESLRLQLEKSEDKLFLIEQAYKPVKPSSPNLALCIIAPVMFINFLVLILTGYLDRKKWIIVS